MYVQFKLCVHWNVTRVETFVSAIGGNKLFKVNNRPTRTRCEIFSKLIFKTPERLQCFRPGVFIVYFEQFSQIVLMFPIVDLKQVNSGWELQK